MLELFVVEDNNNTFSLMDGTQVFDNFDTEQEAYDELNRINKANKVLKEIELIETQFDEDHLRAFIEVHGIDISDHWNTSRFMESCI